MGLDEVQAVLLGAWETAAELLTDIVGDPAGLSWAAPPTTELRITCEQPVGNRVLPALDTLLDLAQLGVNSDGPGPRMAVTVIVAPAMDPSERRRLLRQAPAIRGRPPREPLAALSPHAI